VKDNQPKLRERLELGAARRKPSGFATTQAKGRNRWETRELTVFPAKAREWLLTISWNGRTASVKCAVIHHAPMMNHREPASQSSHEFVEQNRRINLFDFTRP